MPDDFKDAKMTLDATDSQLSRMSKEMEEAPTYAVKVIPTEHRVVIHGVQGKVEEDELSTQTCIKSQSLYHKFSDLRSEVPPELQGRRYESVEVLGEGGAGIVYGMIDHNMGREVAVKIVKNLQTTEERRAFIREGKVSAQLEHPNIVPVYDLEADESGQAYLTMKKVEGHNLKSYIDGKVDLSLDDVISIFMKACDALEYAHSKGKIHQDIKPENIMFGEYGEVFVIDWGASSLQGDDLQLSPVYMSPQQAKGDVSEVRDDVYCLGASLFHVLTKRFPTGATTINELWDKKSSGVIDPPSVRERKQLPKALLAIAMKAMNPKPEDRYQTVEAFANDLKAYQAGFATTAEDAGLFYHLGLLAKRRMKESIIAFIAICIMGTMGMIYFASIKRAQVAKAEAETARVAAELKAIQLAEELKDSWAPLISWDFRKPESLPKLSWFNAYSRVDDGFKLHFDSTVNHVPVYEGFLAEPKLEITFSSPRVPSLQFHFSYPQMHVARGFRVAHGISLEAYDPHYSTPYQGPMNLSGILSFDKPNVLTCWLENSTWYVDLNGTRVAEYYDQNIGAVNLSGRINVSRHVPICPLTIHSIKLWQRRPPNYVSILEPGRVLRSSGDMVNARKWFLAQSNLLTNHRQVQEAIYLAALTDAEQGLEVQLKELNAIYHDTSSPFRFNALHHMTARSTNLGDWKSLMRLTEEATGVAPELNTYRLVAGQLKQSIRVLPYGERLEALGRITQLPVSILELTHLSLTDLTFLKGRLNPTVKRINISDNPIRDLGPLSGTKLKIVEMNDTQVSDLSPIVNPELKEVRLSRTKVSNFSPLSGLSMDLIMAKNCPPIDASTFKGVTTERLVLDNSPIKNSTALGWTNAKTIRLNNCGLKDTLFMEKLNPPMLRVIGNDISTLSGFENKTMTVLDLSHNAITDISPLATCNVTQSINIEGNPIVDLSPLQGKACRSLDVSNTKVRDLSVLKTMPNLQYFRYKGTYKDQPITVDLTAIGELAVKGLELSGLGIDDIRPLATCKIVGRLDLSNNPITDASPLRNQPLRSLNLLNTRLRTLDGLDGLEEMKSLRLGYDQEAGEQPLWDLTPLRSAQLESIKLANCRIPDLSPIDSFSGLDGIELDNVSTNYDALAIPNLKYLRIANSPIANLSFTKGFKHLVSVSLENCDLGENPSQALRTMIGLRCEHLALIDCGITEVTPLNNCYVGQSLNLSGNPITDLSPLQGMTIGKLDVSGTKVADFSVLRNVKGLKRLDVKEMNLTPEQKQVLDSLSLEVIVFK